MDFNESVVNGSEEGNSSQTVVDPFYFYEVEQQTVLWILLIVIIVGNSGVFSIITCGNARKSRMNYFIMHLAIADFLVGSISVLTDIIWHFTISWNAGNVMCKIVRFSQVLVTYGATYVLVALSIDRYYAIRYPMKFSGSWKRAKALIVTAWLFSIIFASPILLLYEEKQIQGVNQCWIEFNQQWHWQVYMTIVALTLFIGPVIVITYCYGIIVATIWSKRSITVAKVSTKSNKENIGEHNSKRASSKGVIPKAKIKTVKIALSIVSIFILCWSPYFLFDLLQVYGYIPHTQTMVAISTFIQSLVHLNSAANPIVYFVFSTNFCSRICSGRIFGHYKYKGRSMTLRNQTNTSTLSDSGINNTRTSLNNISMSVYKVK